MDTVKIVKFIETTLTRKGDGTEDDPVRIVKQYWDFDGKLIFSLDTLTGALEYYPPVD